MRKGEKKMSRAVKVVFDTPYCGTDEISYYIFGDNDDYSLIPIIHRKFNMFTLSYLNNILMNKVEDQVVDILYNWANLKEYEDMIGVTDNDMCINICYEIFHNQKDINFNDLLIDHIDQEKIKQKAI